LQLGVMPDATTVDMSGCNIPFLSPLTAAQLASVREIPAAMQKNSLCRVVNPVADELSIFAAEEPHFPECVVELSAIDPSLGIIACA
jgi:hypothetical protein